MDNLDPNDPKVYTNADAIRQLDPRGKLIAMMNLEKTGQVVFGNQTLTLELMLERMGYNITPDGSFTEEERKALQHFDDQLKDKHFKEAATELISMIGGATLLSELSEHPEQDMKPTQSAAAKIVSKLFSDPM